MNLEKLIEKHFAPKKGNELLIEMIESKLNESELPKIFTTSPIDIEAGKINTPARQEYDELLKNIKSGSPLLWQRIAKVNSFLTEPKKIIKSASIKKAFSSLLLIQEIKENLEKLEPTMAGFQAETIIAQLIDGTKEANNGAVDVESQKFGGFQIKTLKETSPSVGGSFLNVLDFYQQRKGEEGLEISPEEQGEVQQKTKQNYHYIIILKSQPQGVYNFFAFELTFEDFVQNFELSGYKSAYNGYIPPENLTKELFEEFRQTLGSYFNPQNNSIFIPAFDPSQVKSPNDMKRRFAVLKFLEKNKRKIIERGGSSYYELKTTFSLKSSYVSSLLSNRSSPGSGPFVGTLDLTDDRLKQVREEYKRSLTGKMFEVLNLFQQSAQTMNRYFATENQSVGNETITNLNNTSTKFQEYFIKQGEE